MNHDQHEPETVTLPSVYGALLAENAKIVELANAVVVDSPERDEHAKVLAQRIASEIKRREAVTAPYVADAHALHKRAKARENALIDPLRLAKDIVSDKVVGYEREAQRAAQAEKIRLEAEGRAEEERRRRADAFAAARAGDKEAAAAIRAEPIQAPRVEVAPATAKVAGSSTRGTWKAEVRDLAALIAYIAGVETKDLKRPDLVYLLTASAAALNNIAKAQKERMALPGVRAYEERSLASRASGF